MKKVLTFLIIATVLSIASSAMAAEVTVKVPSLLCIDMDLYLDKHQLVLKSSGSIYDPIGNVKTYTITGRDRYGVISGSGYVKPNTTIFYATYSGTHLVSPNIAPNDPPGPLPQNATYFLEIDLTKTDKAGKIEFTFTYPDWQGHEPIILNSNLLTPLPEDGEQTLDYDNILSFTNNSGSDIVKCNTLDASFQPVIQGSAAADGGQKYNECTFPPR